MADDASKQRLERNEQIVRDKNVRSEQAVKQYFQGDEKVIATPIEFVCECSNTDCAQRVMLSIKDYEEIHRQHDHFIVYKGHEMPDIERIVANKEGFHIIEKL